MAINLYYWGSKKKLYLGTKNEKNCQYYNIPTYDS